MTKRKPETQEEIIKDIEAHQERGKIDGEDVVHFKSTEITFTLPLELNSQLLGAAGALGFNKSQMLQHIVASYISQPGVVAMVKSWEESKAEKHNVTTKTVRDKARGCYKRVAREKRARVAKGGENVEQ